MSDVEDLVRVLVEHRFVTTLGRCACGWKPSEYYWPNAVAQHQAEVLLASGVVDVRKPDEYVAILTHCSECAGSP